MASFLFRPKGLYVFRDHVQGRSVFSEFSLDDQKGLHAHGRPILIVNSRLNNYIYMSVLILH